MIKRISSLALSMVIALGLFAQQAAAADDAFETLATSTITEEVSVEETDSIPEPDYDVYVDQVPVEGAELVFVRGMAYVPLRSVVTAMYPNTIFGWTREKTTLNTETLSVSIYSNDNYVIANGRCLHIPLGICYADGSMLFPARLLATIFDAEFSYNSEDQSIHFTRGSGALLSGEEFYDEDSLHWLSHIIHAESGNQPLDGMIAVGNVVLNRVAHPVFPNTIYDVIFQANQFGPVRNGTINLEPNEKSIIAAKLCLDGAMLLPTAYWFNGVGAPCWASQNKECIMVIGNHAFYG